MPYAIPDELKPVNVARPWEVGVYTGVANAVRAEAATRTEVSYSPLVSIPGTTKKVAASKVETRGSITSGSASVPLASAASFAVGHGVSLCGVARLIVTAGASASGQVRIVLNLWDYYVDVAAGDSVAQVAAKIAAMTWRGEATAINLGDGTWEVRFYLRSRAVNFVSEWFNAYGQTTGVTFAAIGHDKVEVPYMGQFAEVTAVSGNTLTLDAAADATHANIYVAHDDGPAMQAAFDGLTPGKKLTFPSGISLRAETAFHLRSNRATVIAPAMDVELWGFAQSSSIGATGGPPVYVSERVLGGMTKGSTSVQISNSAGYAVGDFIQIQLGNLRSQPVLASQGYDVTLAEQRPMRVLMVEVTAIPDSTHLSFFPPVPQDHSSVVCFLTTPWTVAHGSGIEGIRFSAANTRSNGQGGIIGVDCWFSDVKVSQGKNFMPGFFGALRCTMSRCFLDRMAGTGPGRQGLNMAACTGCLFEDGIVYGMAPLTEFNAGAIWSAVVGSAFIISTDGSDLAGADINLNHSAHNSFILVEGCWIQGAAISDSYHGSGSHLLFLRNHFDGINGAPTTGANVYAISLCRWTRHALAAGNQFYSSTLTGWNNDGVERSGRPNMGNPSHDGTVDASLDSPDFHRAYDTQTGLSLSGGVMTCDHDAFLPTDTEDQSQSRQVRVVLVSGKYRYRVTGYTNARTVSVANFDNNPSDPNPTTLSGASFTIWGNSGPGAWQELDLAVAPTVHMVANTSLGENGGLVTDDQSAPLGGDPLFDSLVYATRPAYLDAAQTELGQTFEFPAYGPRSGNINHRNESASAIPAGARFFASIAPRLLSASVNSAGTQLTLTFNKVVHRGADGLAGLRIFNTLAPTIGAYASGDGTTQIVVALSRAILEAAQEQPKIDYAQPGDGVQDANSNRLETLTNFACNNGSLNIGNTTEVLSIPFADTVLDVAELTYAALGDYVTLTQPMTANKLVAGVGSLGSAPPGTGVVLGLYAVEGGPGTSNALATFLRETVASATGPDRMVSNSIEPIDLAPGTYFVATRTSDGGARLRGIGTGGAQCFFSDDAHPYFASVPAIYLRSITNVAMNKTVCVGIRGIVNATPPAAPTGLSATAASSTRIDLGWTDASNNEDGFKIMRGTSPDALAEIDFVAPGTSSYAALGLNPGTQYFFRVDAYNGGGRTASATASATTQVPPSASVLGFPQGPSAGATHTRGRTSWIYNGRGWQRA